MHAIVAGAAPSRPAGQEQLARFSLALEDEAQRDLTGAALFAAFQRESSYARVRTRWDALASGARSAYVFADFPHGTTARPGGPVEVDLDPDSPMRREWSVVVDRPHGGFVMAALERIDPGGQRVFDAAWTTEPAVVRTAARVCALTASAAGSPGADAVVFELAHLGLGEPDADLQARLDASWDDPGR